MRFYPFLLVFFFSLVAFSQTVLVDHSSDNKDDLWSMGAADVMSFYLQEQGVEVVHRGQLDSMINELSIADAELAKSDIRKGKWKGAEYVVSGQVIGFESGLKLSLKISNIQNGKIVKSYVNTFKNEDELALEIENQARQFARVIQNLDNKKKPLNRLDSDHLFSGVNASVLYHYYYSVNLILSDKDQALGLSSMYHLMETQPNFKPPYLWLATFFENNNLSSLASCLRDLVNIKNKKSDKSSPSSRRVYFKTNGKILFSELKALQNVLNEHKLTLVEPETLNVFDREQDLSKWGYVVNKNILSKVDQFSCAYILVYSRDESNDYKISLINSSNSENIKTIQTKDFKRALNQLYKSLDDLNTNKPDTINIDNKEVYLGRKLSSSIFKKRTDFYNYLFRYIEKYSNTQVVLELWLHSFIERFHNINVRYKRNNTSLYQQKKSVRESLYEEILKQCKSDQRIFFKVEKLFDEIVFTTRGLRPKIEAFVQECEQLSLSNKSSILELCNSFNNASLLIDKDNIKALKGFLNLRPRIDQLKKIYPKLNQTRFKYLLESTDYWIWYCAKKLNHNELPLYKQRVVDHQNNNAQLFQLFFPRYEKGWKSTLGYYRSFRPRDELADDGSITKVNKWSYILYGEKLELPILPSKPNEKTWLIAKDFINVYLDRVNSGEKMTSQKIYKLRDAISFYINEPSKPMGQELHNKCVDYALSLNNTITVDLLLVLGEYKKAKDHILAYYISDQKLMYNQLVYFDYRVLSQKIYIHEISQFYIKEISKEVFDSFDVFGLIREALSSSELAVASNLINFLKSKNLDERRKTVLMYLEAKLKYLEADFITALFLLKDANKKCIGKSYMPSWGKRVGGDELKVKIERLINKINSLENNNYRAAKWPMWYRGSSNPPYYGGAPKSASDVLRADVKKEFKKLYLKYFFQNSVEVSTADLKSFVGDFDENFLLAEIYRFYNSTPTKKETDLIRSIIMHLAVKNNQKEIFHYYSNDWRYADAAFKLAPEKATEILVNNAWAFPEKSLYSNFRKYIINYQIKDLEYVLKR